MHKKKSVEGLIPLDTISKSGVFIITVHFADYKHNYANDTRRILGGGRGHKGLAEEAKERGIEVDLIPLNYWLGRTIIDKVTRATGGLYKFGYSNMTPERFKMLFSILEDMKKRYCWWETVEILVGNRIEGYQ